MLPARGAYQSCEIVGEGPDAAGEGVSATVAGGMMNEIDAAPR